MTVTSVPVRLLKSEYAIRTREFFLGVGKNFNDTKTSIDPSRTRTWRDRDNEAFRVLIKQTASRSVKERQKRVGERQSFHTRRDFRSVHNRGKWKDSRLYPANE